MTDIGKAGPLAGVKVLDLTIAMAGPLATARMSDLGASVIKIESPSGDFSRLWPIDGYWHGKESSAFLMLNRGKRDICLDLKQASSKAVFEALAKDADIIVQNFRPRVAAKLGIDYESVHRLNPKLVYVSISGYGDRGPMVDRPGQDLLVQSFSGMTFNAGGRDDLPHPSPIYLVDTCASHLAVEAALSGYIEALRTGIGRHLKVSLLSAVLEVQIQEISTYLNTGRLPGRSKRPFASNYMEPPYGIYRTRDGFIAVAQAKFPALASAFNDAEIEKVGAAAPSHDDIAARQEWRDRVGDLVAAHFAKQTTQELIDRLTPLDIWVNPVMSYAELVKHPQFETMAIEIDHPAGPYKTLAPAIDDGTPRSIRPAPALGEHTDEILGEIGMSGSDIKALRDQGAVK